MTNFTTTEAVAPAPEGPRKPTHKVRNAVLIGVGVTVALIIGIAAGNSGSHPAASQAPAPPATSAPAQPAPATSNPATSQPAPATSAPAAPATSAPPAPAGPTAAQQQALDSAQGYLSDGQGFSRGSLIDQLEFEKFSAADAAWAADNAGADWNAQAADSAKGYVNDGQGFSRQGLIDQLEFEKFTPAQAAYGASQAGL
jgi:hypothetical protein